MKDRVVVVKSELDDWWLVEKAEHDGRTWIGPVSLGEGMGAVMGLQRSARVADAEVEGTGAEMLALALAIEQGRGESFGRCAVDPRGDGSWWISSPRNSIMPGVISGEAALALADDIRAKVLG